MSPLMWDQVGAVSSAGTRPASLWCSFPGHTKGLLFSILKIYRFRGPDSIRLASESMSQPEMSVLTKISVSVCEKGFVILYFMHMQSGGSGCFKGEPTASANVITNLGI